MMSALCVFVIGRWQVSYGGTMPGNLYFVTFGFGNKHLLLFRGEPHCTPGTYGGALATTQRHMYNSAISLVVAP